MLDLFFKKYLWTANALLIVASAWLSAKTVNTVVGAAIRPKPNAELTSAPPPPPRPPVPTHVDADPLYKLFGLKPPEAPPPEDAAQQAAAAAPRTCEGSGAPVKSGLRVQLVAGVIAERPEWSIASITDLNTRETKIYGVGDDLNGAQVLSIEKIKDDKSDAAPSPIEGVPTDDAKVVVIVCNNGQKEYVDFDPGDGSGAQASVNLGTYPVPMHGVAPADEGGGPAGGASMDGIRKVTDNRYEIKRQVIDGVLSNLNTIATQARIVPSFKNGVSNGFKLFSIQPGSLYSSIGIENGDVIQRINGYEMNSPEKALEIYQKLKESNHVTVEVERNGSIIRKEYNIGQ